MLQAARQALTQADHTLKTTNNVIHPERSSITS